MRDHDQEAWTDPIVVDRAIRTGIRGIAARSICTGPVFPLRMPISRRWPIMDSSICGLMNARGCVASDHFANRNSASDRSSRAEIHYPLLRPLVARRIGDLPEPMRQELVPLLKELSADARGRTEAS